ncbi:MAG TPA: FAD-binding oxidoreductase [Burkholderiaceae bacterium]|nr:FAD-binding oxidoreductase [Burkholderiaceae bacterium]
MSVIIVGGGVIGCAAAFFLARDHGVRAVVLERDPAYRRASSALSASSIRQQFSTPINILLSQASFDFYRRLPTELEVDGERPDIGLVERGYLYLASPAGMATLRANQAVQKAHGAAVLLLDADGLAHRFPWLAVDGLAGGALGMAGEGWFDGYSVLQAFRRKAIGLGVSFVPADAVRIERHGGRIDVHCGDGIERSADALLLAAGAWSAPLAAQCGFDLPVRARKRDVFVVSAPARLADCPLVIDPAGVWFRPEGRGFICGAPPRGADPDDAPLDAIDYGLFDEVIWPRLAARVPAFEALRMERAWAGYYEYNTFDQNGIVGRLPSAQNVFVATGFSGHGIQQAPAVGRGIAELIATGAYRALDLAPLAPDRIARGMPLIERNVI